MHGGLSWQLASGHWFPTILCYSAVFVIGKLPASEKRPEKGAISQLLPAGVNNAAKALNPAATGLDGEMMILIVYL